MAGKGSLCAAVSKKRYCIDVHPLGPYLVTLTIVFVLLVMESGFCTAIGRSGMFTDITDQLDINTTGAFTGVTVTDVDHDGNFDIVVARYGRVKVTQFRKYQ